MHASVGKLNSIVKISKKSCSCYFFHENFIDPQHPYDLQNYCKKMLLILTVTGCNYNSPGSKQKEHEQGISILVVIIIVSVCYDY